MSSWIFNFPHVDNGHVPTWRIAVKYFTIFDHKRVIMISDKIGAASMTGDKSIK